MPIYEYRCECGAVVESLERMGTVRTECAELCVNAAAAPAKGLGRVERTFSSGMIPRRRARGERADVRSLQALQPTRRTLRLTAPLLDVQGLVVTFDSEAGPLRAVDDVSFSVAAGRALGLVGESGSGKSATALALLDLLAPPGRVAAGRIWFDGRDLRTLTARELRSVRGAEMAMIFQEPMTALNPVMTVGEQVAEPLVVHGRCTRRQAGARAVELLRSVGLSDALQRARSFPHELSGGMRQRVLIAMALACGPRLLIADESTTALDATVAAQILTLLDEQRRALGMALLLITHDLAIVAERCDDVAVLYAGQIVEAAPTTRLFAAPRHPYSRGLLDSVPRLGSRRAGQRLAEIPGVVPRLDERPPGCRFAPRCSRVQPKCTNEAPVLAADESGHAVRCFFPLS